MRSNNHLLNSIIDQSGANILAETDQFAAATPCILGGSLPLLWSIRRGIRLIHQDWPACTGSLNCLMEILTVLVPAGPRQ